MSARCVVALAALVLLLPGALTASVIRVPGDQPTVQAGMDAAADGDTVLVAPGTYSGVGNRDLSFGGKNLVVMSEAGPELTVIDCQATWDNPHRGFTVSGQVIALIRGLTIVNGYSYGSGMSGGGGISSVSSTLILADCVIMNCEGGTHASTYCSGGGLFCSGGTIEATGCAFVSNESGSDVAGSGNGGGVYCERNSGEFRDCVFSGNLSHGVGGGVSAYLSDLVFQSCVFRGNWTGDSYGGDGGGFYGGLGVFRDVTFYGNGADGHGGGAFAGGTFEGVVFDWNYARNDGGGLWSYGTTTKVTDALFTRNHAEERGGAIFCSAGSFERVVVSGGYANIGGGIACRPNSTFRNVTLVDNEANSEGSALSCLWGSSLFTHTIVAFNEAVGAVQAVQGEGTPAFDCSDVYGNDGGDWVGSISSQFGLNGNISENPLFCDAQGHDFTIDAGSPCAPSGNTCSDLIGALGVGCSTTSVQRSTWSGIKALYR